MRVGPRTEAEADAAVTAMARLRRPTPLDELLAGLAAGAGGKPFRLPADWLPELAGRHPPGAATGDAGTARPRPPRGGPAVELGRRHALVARARLAGETRRVRRDQTPRATWQSHAEPGGARAAESCRRRPSPRPAWRGGVVTVPRNPAVNPLRRLSILLMVLLLAVAGLVGGPTWMVHALADGRRVERVGGGRRRWLSWACRSTTPAASRALRSRATRPPGTYVAGFALTFGGPMLGGLLAMGMSMFARPVPEAVGREKWMTQAGREAGRTARRRRRGLRPDWPNRARLRWPGAPPRQRREPGRQGRRPRRPVAPLLVTQRPGLRREGRAVGGDRRLPQHLRPLRPASTRPTRAACATTRSWRFAAARTRSATPRTSPRCSSTTAASRPTFTATTPSGIRRAASF